MLWRQGRVGITVVAGLGLGDLVIASFLQVFHSLIRLGTIWLRVARWYPWGKVRFSSGDSPEIVGSSTVTAQLRYTSRVSFFLCFSSFFFSLSLRCSCWMLWDVISKREFSSRLNAFSGPPLSMRLPRTFARRCRRRRQGTRGSGRHRWARRIEPGQGRQSTVWVSSLIEPASCAVVSKSTYMRWRLRKANDRGVQILGSGQTRSLCRCSLRGCTSHF